MYKTLNIINSILTVRQRTLETFTANNLIGAYHAEEHRYTIKDEIISTILYKNYEGCATINSLSREKKICTNGAARI